MSVMLPYQETVISFFLSSFISVVPITTGAERRHNSSLPA